MITIPTRSRGRQSAAAITRYQAQLAEFADAIRELATRSDFAVSSRGWCYILEEHGLKKGDFDKAQGLINDCRLSGLLPLDICAEDEARAAQVPADDADFTSSVEDFAQGAFEMVREDFESAEDDAREQLRTMYFTPYRFWEYQEYYVEVLVEKIDLRSLFERVCLEYKVPIGNGKGWTDIHSRGAIMRRFQTHIAEGRKCVLLYCGDHDPAGLSISNKLRENFLTVNGVHYIDGTRIEVNPDKIEFVRFGLNHEFIAEHNLSWIEGLHTGSGDDLANPKHPHHQFDYVQSYLRQFGARKCEANALVTRPEAARALMKSALLEFVDEDAEQQRRQDNYAATVEVRDQLRDQAQEVLGWTL